LAETPEILRADIGQFVLLSVSPDELDLGWTQIACYYFHLTKGRTRFPFKGFANRLPEEKFNDEVLVKPANEDWSGSRPGWCFRPDGMVWSHGEPKFGISHQCHVSNDFLADAGDVSVS
jgi:hypothetical protein